MNISERIFYLLEQQEKTASQLGEYIGVKSSSINGWKNGSFPSSKYIEKIASFFNVSIAYLVTGAEEQSLGKTKIDVIYSLNEDNLSKAISYAEYLSYKEEKEKQELLLVSKETKKHTGNSKEPIQISEHIKEATGSEKEQPEEQNFLPVLGYTAAGEPIEVPDDIYSFDDLVAIPLGIKADFALTVRGDSMEPDIPNGSTVAVKKQETVENGQIAIVSLNNHITCKTFRRHNGTISLHSINRKYDPITIKEEDNIEVKIIGRVVR